MGGAESVDAPNYRDTQTDEQRRRHDRHMNHLDALDDIHRRNEEMVRDRIDRVRRENSPVRSSAPLFRHTRDADTQIGMGGDKPIIFRY